MAKLRERWLSIRRGWRIAITTVVAAVVLLAGTWVVLYQCTALARQFDATLMGVLRLAGAQNQLALSDDQIKQILVPLRNLEIQESISRDAARSAMADMRAALTPEQLQALSSPANRIGRLPAGMAGGARGGGRLRQGYQGGAPPAGANDRSGTSQQPGTFPGGRSYLGQRRAMGIRLLTRWLAPLRTQLPQPAVISQACQRLENIMNGVTPVQPGGQAPATNPADGTSPK